MPLAASAKRPSIGSADNLLPQSGSDAKLRAQSMRVPAPAASRAGSVAVGAGESRAAVASQPRRHTHHTRAQTVQQAAKTSAKHLDASKARVGETLVAKHNFNNHPDKSSGDLQFSKGWWAPFGIEVV